MTDKAKPDESPIQFMDLKAQQARIRDKIEARLIAVLDHGQYINGPELFELEETLCEFTGAADCVGVASGTDSLIIAMMGEGIGAGDAVFIPSVTYNATVGAVLLAGATPVFVDVQHNTFNMDPADLAAKIEGVLAEGELAPKMVIPVDLFGLPADYPCLEKVASQYDLQIMADAAQSFGGSLGNTRVGALTPISSTSFFPGKGLGAYGDAGALFTMDKAKGEVWRSIRWHGTDEGRKESVRVGFNGRLDSMQAGVLLEKLAIFPDELELRAKHAAHYDARLGERIELPARGQGFQSSWGYYTVALETRDKVQAALKAASIPCAAYYSQPLHTMKAFAPFAPEGGLPVAERLAGELLSLPMHPYLTEGQVDRVADVVLNAL
jgi:dTDP-4-amino-4,6-dideoxygalactose transaminase